MNKLAKPKKPVNIINMILISFLPFGWVYVFKKLNKLRFGFLLTTVTIVPVVIINYTIGFPWGMISSFAMLALTCYIIRNLCINYNRSLDI